MGIRWKAAINHVVSTAVLAASLSIVATVLPAQDSTPPDNTKANKNNHGDAGLSADQQKNNASDRDITRKIRQAIQKDKSLSTYAHNVKIITQEGVVTLKGPVRSDEEKSAIAAKAAEVAGESNVKNHLTVKQESSGGR